MLWIYLIMNYLTVYFVKYLTIHNYLSVYNVPNGVPTQASTILHGSCHPDKLAKCESTAAV